MLTINSKADLIVPFHKIGDAGWIAKTGTILEALNNNWSREAPEPLAEAELTALETRLGTTLPDTLKVFYQNFGIAGIGEALQEPDDIDYLQHIWVVDDEHGPQYTVADKAVLPFLVTFSEYLGNGNMFCFHSQTKAIYYFDHENSPRLYKLFDQADDYLKGCLIFAQGDLFGEDVEQEQVDEWAEEIVTDLFGTDVVRTWRY